MVQIDRCPHGNSATSCTYCVAIARGYTFPLTSPSATGWTDAEQALVDVARALGVEPIGTVHKREAADVADDCIREIVSLRSGGCTEDCEVDDAGYCKHAGPIVRSPEVEEAATLNEIRGIVLDDFAHCIGEPLWDVLARRLTTASRFIGREDKTNG